MCTPVIAVLIYAYWVRKRRVRIRDTIIGYVYGVVLSGLILGVLGMRAGAYLTCVMLDDRFCGVGGALLGAPFAATGGIAAFIYVWARRHKASGL